MAEARQDFGDRYGIEGRYADARDMMDKEGLDVVSICTWHKLHAPMTIAACARRPKAILCEKPMAVNMGECDEMMIAVRRNDVKLAIAHQRRFNPVWTDARNLIAEGAVGKVRHVTCSGSQGLLNDCSHMFDFMRYVLGDPAPEWVIGNISNARPTGTSGISASRTAARVSWASTTGPWACCCRNCIPSGARAGMSTARTA